MYYMLKYCIIKIGIHKTLIVHSSSTNTRIGLNSTNFSNNLEVVAHTKAHFGQTRHAKVQKES